MLSRIAILAGAGVLLAGCEMFSPPAQQITVTTLPAGARCEFDDRGYMLANVQATPGVASVQMPDHEVKLVCRLQGHPNVSAMVGNQSKVSLTFEPGLIPNPAPTQPVTTAPIRPPGN